MKRHGANVGTVAWLMAAGFEARPSRTGGGTEYVLAGRWGSSLVFTPGRLVGRWVLRDGDGGAAELLARPRTVAQVRQLCRLLRFELVPVTPTP